MTQAARSGCANNAEGSARRATSQATEMTLTDVARSSLAELAGDSLNWLLRKEDVPRDKTTPEARAVYAARRDKAESGTDVLHDACRRILAQQRKFSKGLDSGDDVLMANVLLILIARVINRLNPPMETQGGSVLGRRRISRETDRHSDGGAGEQGRRTGMPAVREAHAPPEGPEREERGQGILGLFRLSRLPGRSRDDSRTTTGRP